MAREFPLKHELLTSKIIAVFYEVYNELGHGFLESIYEDAMEIALKDAGLVVQRQLRIPVYFRGRLLAEHRADLMVEGAVIVENKCARAFDAAHEAQLLHYLRATNVEVGLLFNYGIKPEFRRLVFDNERKKLPVIPPT